MRVKEIIEKIGIDRETLRFYEKKGLLPRANRTSANYRDFPEEVLSRLRFIKTAQSAGFTLAEIKELVELRSQAVSCRQGRNIAIQKQQELKEKAKALREMQRILTRFIRACESKGEKGLSRKCHFSFEKMSR